MSGTSKRDIRPKTDAELMREQDRRVENLENSDAVRVGQWTLTTQPDTGNLIASYENGGSWVVAKVPDAETDADAVQDVAEVPVVDPYEPPRIQVRRSSNLAINNSTFTTVTYESTEFTEGSNPIVENLGTGILTIGETGVYQITAEFQWQGNAALCNLTLLIAINGSSTAEDNRIRQNITTGHSLSVTRTLTEGNTVEVVVWHDSAIGPSWNGGATHGGDISARFNITLVQSVRVDGSGTPPDSTPIV